MSPEFTEVINELRLSNEFCDAKILLEDGSEFLIHRNILSACSEYFRALFTTHIGREEAVAGGVQVTTSLPWIDKGTMLQIIDYAYTRRLELNTDNVYEIYIAMDYLRITKARSMCTAFVVRNLTPENCINVLEFGKDYMNGDIVKSTEEYILLNFSEVARVSNILLKKPLDFILKLISSDDLNVLHEEEVWEFAIRWVNTHQNTRRYQLSILMKEMKLGLIDENYFNNQIKQHNFVKNIYTCRCIAQEVSQFFDQLQNMSKLNFEFVTPKFAQPRISPSVLLAIGGWSGGSPTNAIEAYDSKADRWTRIKDNDGAKARAYHGTAVLDNKIYIIGGFEGREYFNSCLCYDVNTETWNFVSPMNCRRCYVSVAVLGGYIYAFGGFDGHIRQNSAERYDPNINQWALISSMNVARSDADATVLNDKIYVTGGFNGLECLNSAEVFDPELNLWSILPVMLSRRSGVSCIAYRDCVYAVGGFDGINRLRSAERFDPVADRWSEVPSMRTTRSNFAVDVVDDAIVVMGGFDGTTTIPHVEIFDIHSGYWKQATDMNVHRSALSSCVIQRVPRNSMTKYLYPDRKNLLGEKCRRLKEYSSIYPHTRPEILNGNRANNQRNRNNNNQA